VCGVYAQMGISLGTRPVVPCAYTVQVNGTISVDKDKWMTLTTNQRKRIVHLNRKATTESRKAILAILDEQPVQTPAGTHGIRNGAVMMAKTDLVANAEAAKYMGISNQAILRQNAPAPRVNPFADVKENASDADFAKRIMDVARANPVYVNGFVTEAKRRIARDGGISNAIRVAVDDAKKAIAKAEEDKKEFDRRMILLAEFNGQSPRKLAATTVISDTGVLVLADCGLVAPMVEYGESRGAAWTAGYDRLKAELLAGKMTWGVADHRSSVFIGASDGYHVCTVTGCEGKENHGQMIRYFEIELKAHRFPPTTQINPKTQLIVKFKSGYLLACDPVELENRYAMGRSAVYSTDPNDLILQDIERSPPRKCNLRPITTTGGALVFGLPKAGAYDLVVRQKKDASGYPYEVLCCETSSQFFLMDGLHVTKTSDV
jgi:hypothetical protein